MPSSNNICVLKKETISKYVQDVANRLLEASLSYERIHLICILDGARKFCEKLEDILFFQKEIYTSFIKTRATYDNQLLENVTLIYEQLPSDNFLDDKPTIHIIVDDLLDSGKTINFAKEYLQSRSYKNIFTCVFINKFAKNLQKADFVGFDMKLDKEKMQDENIKDYWLYGFGMDLDDNHRDLEEIRSLVINT